MIFSSPYNKEDRIGNTPVFYSIDVVGNLYHVEEKYVLDRRRKSGQRLTRIDIDTGADLMAVSMCVLPSTFENNGQGSLVLLILELMDNQEKLEDRLQYMEYRVADIEARVNSL